MLLLFASLEMELRASIAGAVMDHILKPNMEIWKALALTFAHCEFKNDALWYDLPQETADGIRDLVGTLYGQDIKVMLLDLGLIFERNFTFDRPKMFDRLWKETEHDIRQNWKAIERVAILLDKRKHLSGEEFDACILEGSQ